jgi:hypothetical protein
MPNEVEVSPIFSTSALRSSISEAGLFLFLKPSGEHLAKRFHDQRK